MILTKLTQAFLIDFLWQLRQTEQRVFNSLVRKSGKTVLNLNLVKQPAKLGIQLLLFDNLKDFNQNGHFRGNKGNTQISEKYSKSLEDTGKVLIGYVDCLIIQLPDKYWIVCTFIIFSSRSLKIDFLLIFAFPKRTFKGLNKSRVLFQHLKTN